SRCRLCRPHSPRRKPGRADQIRDRHQYHNRQSSGPRCAAVDFGARRRGDRMRRREFMLALGGAAAWPLGARAQQTATPLIGFLSLGWRESDAPRLAGLRRGLSEAGYIEGTNLAVEYRWAENQFDRLPTLTGSLIQARVALIVTPGLPATLVARAATTTIPILFGVGADPAQIGLVASLNRPGGNLTGFNQLNGELGTKRLALLHELVPSARVIGFLENPGNPLIEELATADVLRAAPAIGVQIQALKAGTEREIDAAFETLAHARTGALLVPTDFFFNSRMEQISTLSAHHAIPVMHSSREFVAAGGLISYGSSLSETYRPVGVYAGRILKGEKPADLPVVQSTKLELVINLKAAKAFGLTVPDKLLALADEVIE